ncbi:hypothetical protein A1OE_1046 [Candidatus Endolissoclinum faulkneri L2]|uniref:Uncharacterized protein n=1 Tax=Candidatus Endolissoclinum faulkneri L2 TaxID=1193729 RepID=K7YRP4_9PROT|nr:hypothetical protein A1OE_1046 [Candidatus Endolissoclinum faulkneri L2]
MICYLLKLVNCNKTIPDKFTAYYYVHNTSPFQFLLILKMLE